MTHHADLVLIQELQGLHQFKLQILRQTAHVVVGLHRAALQNVGVNGALGQKLNAVQLAGLFLEDPDELGADDLALLLRFGHTGKLVQKTVHRVHIDEIGVHFVPEDPDDLLGLALAQETVVHVHAGELLAHSLDEQRRHHGRIHAAGKGQQDLLVPDLRTQRVQLLVDESPGQLGRGDALHGFGTDIVCHSVYPLISIFLRLIIR